MYLKTIKRDNQQSHMLTQKLSGITNLMGIEQDWGLFCPNVRTDNHYNLVVITLQNGFLKLCEMPRMEKLSVMKKMEREKFRKIFNDNFPYPNNLSMQPAFSRFLANATYDKYNPPERLSYFLISEALQAPTDQLLTGRISKKRNDLRPAIVNYFVYGINADDFQ